jgi:hypothetical protein
MSKASELPEVSRVRELAGVGEDSSTAAHPEREACWKSTV